MFVPVRNGLRACPRAVPLSRRRKATGNYRICCSSTAHAWRILLSEFAGYARCFIVHGPSTRLAEIPVAGSPS
jgi:hypothetical protein